MSWVSVKGRDVRLEALDFGGDGPGVLLLHGLAGTAREWEDTAAWLSGTHRVVALDQRGHGRSERRPADVSRGAFVTDAVAAVEQLDLAPVALIGQSLGGHTAFLVAAERPDLVRGLIVAEASPASEDAGNAAKLEAALSSWPAQFSSVEAAEAFFGGDTPRGRAWARNLDGLRPSFDVAVMVRTIAAATEARWEEWRSIEAPTLVVRGAHGDVSEDRAAEMMRSLPCSKVVTLPGGHDVHLDVPEAWRRTVSDFLLRLS